MSYLLIVLGSVVSVLGILFSASGERHRLNRVSLFVVSLVIAIGLLSLFNSYLSARSAQARNAELSASLETAQEMLRIEHLDLAKGLDFFRFLIELPDERVGREGPAAATLPFVSKAATPLFPAGAAGAEIGRIGIDIGEWISRHYRFSQHPDGMLVEETASSDGPEERQTYVSMLDACAFVPPDKPCELADMGGTATWRESIDVFGTGQTISLDSGQIAARIVSALQDNRQVGAMLIPNALAGKGFLARRELVRFYTEGMHYGLLFFQDYPDKAVRDICNYVFSYPVAFERLERPEELATHPLLAAANPDTDIAGVFRISGPVELSFCRAPY
ncbi:hypothetical protein [Hoeflea olei]|uniref:Uncharacterized protein n=1 Tax=Hoeflea olei TaxID=1480615 RepID=A0A1C1Z0H2_9HYPH|nr:hypothetical protein [Hoeflea olei]OCW59264.1 hypothetical protein AWJ14_09450 [Hoeflea olei]